MNPSRDKKLFYSTIILVVVHFFGIIGIVYSPWKDLFILCTPFNLAICLTLLLLNHTNFNSAFYLFCLIIFLLGYFIEVIGVQTGQIFGEYQYGNTLGIKMMNVPVIIGINWLILIYSTGVICNQLKSNIFVKSIAGATLLVILDYFIEPIAIKFDYWTWFNGQIPIQNYIAWFLISMALLLIFYLMELERMNRLAKAIYIVQLVFFILLNIL